MKVKIRRRSEGFTIVEILVVIAILGLLAAIIIPSFNRMKRSAQSTLCVGNLRGIGIALNTYFLDHGTTFPTLVAARESRGDDELAIDTELLEYVGNDELVFKCPSDHQGLFEKTGSSYFWNSLINGQKPSNMDMLGVIDKASGIPIASDKENFHEHVGDGVNMLYADGHVLRELQFSVEEQ